jgi:hypothetical protein
MILEGTDAQVHLLPHDESIELARRDGLLKPNHFVSLSGPVQDKRRASRIRDFGDAEAYLISSQFRPSAITTSREGQVDTQWAGWLGRYLAQSGRASRLRGKQPTGPDR